MAEFAKPGYILNQYDTPLIYSDKIQRQVQSNDKALFTNLTGFAGHSDGCTIVEFTVDSPIPQAGVEFDAAGYAASHTTLTLKFKIAGKTETVRGRVLEESIDTAAGDTTKQSFKFQGGLIARL